MSRFFVNGGKIIRGEVMKERPFRSPKHLEWVGRHPCQITQHGDHCNGDGVDAHHLTFLKDESRMGGKASDKYALPLCRFHHTALHQIGEKRFWESWGYDLEGVKQIALEFFMDSPHTKIEI